MLIKKENNVVCAICGKLFHIPPSMFKFKTHCCSMECSKEWRRQRMTGEKNHQYGLRGDKNASFKGAVTRRKNCSQYDFWVYCPDHPYANKNGRVKLHRFVVEQNADLFPPESFELINGRRVLRKDRFVHHIDENHDNNEVGNLQVVTKGEHISIHNKLAPHPRDQLTGRFLSLRQYKSLDQTGGLAR